MLEDNKTFLLAVGVIVLAFAGSVLKIFPASQFNDTVIYAVGIYAGKSAIGKLSSAITTKKNGVTNAGG